jgi:hypothetical protein
MAHHISDLIIRAESSTGTEANDIRREAADTIVTLWQHRAAAPTHSRPTEALEPVLKALARLANTQSWRFYDIFNPGKEPGHNATTATPLLQLALNLESTIREVVQQIVIVATNAAIDKEAKWLQLSEHIVEDQQRRALGHIRRMQRELTKTQTGPDTDHSTQPGPYDDNSHILSGLLTAETQLRNTRLALEAALPRPSEDTAPGDSEA